MSNQSEIRYLLPTPTAHPPTPPKGRGVLLPFNLSTPLHLGRGWGVGLEVKLQFHSQAKDSQQLAEIETGETEKRPLEREKSLNFRRLSI